MKKLIYIFTVIFLTACGNSNIPDDVSYKIVKEEPNIAFGKDNIEIQLNKKVNESILKAIALEIKKDRKQYDKLRIFYYISEMSDGIAWATTHFTPELEIEIIGSTELQDIETSKTVDIVVEIIGKWRSEQSLMGATLVLYVNSENSLTMRTTFKDGSKMEEELLKSTSRGKTRYDYNNKHGEYYILESNGNLGMYDNDGKFDEAIKIDK